MNRAPVVLYSTWPLDWPVDGCSGARPFSILLLPGDGRR
jgi:hypothetical protein